METMDHGNCLLFWSLWWLHWTNVLCAVVTLIIKNGGRSVEWVNVSQNICRCFNQMVNSRSYGNSECDNLMLVHII